MVKVIEHRKPKKEPRPYREPKPKRYRVEYFSYQKDEWILKEDYRTAWNAKSMARYFEEGARHFKWRVVDTREESVGRIEVDGKFNPIGFNPTAPEYDPSESERPWL